MSLAIRADDAAQPERRSHDQVRHGTTSRFVALDMASGKMIGWLRHPCFHLHFTPTSGSWPRTMVERWFGECTEKKIKRGCPHQRDDPRKGNLCVDHTVQRKPRPYVRVRTTD